MGETNNKKSVIIIGGGIGGLCCGIRLLKNNYDVTIFEKEDSAGGVAKTIYSNYNSYKFDSYASIGICPDEYLKIFDYVGVPADKYIGYTKLDTLFKVFYYDNTEFTFYNSIDKLNNSFEDFFDFSLSEYNQIIEEMYKKYLIADKHILSRDFNSRKRLVNPSILWNTFKIKPIMDTRSYLQKKISSQKLREYLEFQTLFMGITPMDLPAFFLSIPAITQTDGLIYINGGMGNYVSALINLFNDMGGKLQCSHEVNVIKHKDDTITNIACNDKEYTADVYISDTDLTYTIGTLLNLPKFSSDVFLSYQNDNRYYSCSAFIMHLVLQKELPMLDVHNIYINSNFFEEADFISTGITPVTPPVYIYNPSCIDKSFKNNNCISLNIMIRVPKLDFGQLYDKDKVKRLEDICINALKNVTKMNNIEGFIVSKQISTPIDLEEKFNLYDGIAYGIGPIAGQSAFFKPQSASKRFNNLYFTGTNIHPGNGVAVVMKGAEITSDYIIKKNNDTNNIKS